MEKVSVHAISLWTFQVFNVVRSEDLVVRQVFLCLAPEHSFPPDGQLLLEADQGGDVLVVGANVVQKSNDSLTVDGSLNACVADVKSVLAQPMQS